MPLMKPQDKKGIENAVTLLRNMQSRFKGACPNKWMESVMAIAMRKQRLLQKLVELQINLVEMQPELSKHLPTI